MAKSTGSFWTPRTACGWLAERAFFGWIERICSNLRMARSQSSPARLIVRWTVCGPYKEHLECSPAACGPQTAACGFQLPDGCWHSLPVWARGPARFRQWLFENVIIDGESVDPADVRTLGPGRSNVEFEYAALTYLSPQRVTYSYMLEGYDRGWTNAGSRRQAFYTNLAAGKISLPRGGLRGVRQLQRNRQRVLL